MSIAIITGGSRGLGKNMALHLARHKKDVILTYHTQKEEADKVVTEIESLGQKACCLALDVDKAEDFPAFAASIKRLLKEKWHSQHFNYLINNAGHGAFAPYIDTTEEQFDHLVNVHLKAPFFLTQKLLPLMKDGGKIINISSGLTRFSFPGLSAYAVMKGGVEVLTHYLAKELGPRRITANTVAPGAIETDFGGGMVRDNAEINHEIASETPLGRVGLPDDIGGAIAMLLSDESGWINGQRIEVSGGIYM